jgi:hypothetical protein
MGLIRCPKRLVNYHHTTQCNIPEECRHQGKILLENLENLVVERKLLISFFTKYSVKMGTEFVWLMIGKTVDVGMNFFSLIDLVIFLHGTAVNGYIDFVLMSVLCITGQGINIQFADY